MIQPDSPSFLNHLSGTNKGKKGEFTLEVSKVPESSDGAPRESGALRGTTGEDLKHIDKAGCIAATGYVFTQDQLTIASSQEDTPATTIENLRIAKLQSAERTT